jgi:hypothetical protein
VIDGGRLDIVVRWDGARAYVTAPMLRRPDVNALLAGCTATEALVRLPAIYALCGRAQAICARTAFAQLGVAAGSARDTAPPLPAGRVIAAEMIFEHLWRLWLDWPQLLDLPVRTDALARANGLLRGASTEATAISAAAFVSEQVSAYFESDRPAWAALDEATEETASAWRRAAQVGDTGGRGAPAGPGAGDAVEAAPWPSDSPVGRLLDRLESLGAEDRRRAPRPLRPLPDVPLPVLLAGLRRPFDAAFAAAPTFRSQPHEAGAITRFASHPLVKRFLLTGAIPSARLTARLLALIEAVAVLEGARPAPARWVEGLRLGPDEALAKVETARGPLLHYLRLRGDRVAEYRIVAPTEWNFHPAGALADAFAAAGCITRRTVAGVAKASSGAAAASSLAASAEIARRLRAAVLSLDPCVAWSVVVEAEGGRVDA